MRMVVLVNGLPGSGKSTLARPLSTALTLPLLSKDAIKETVADVLGVEPPGEALSQAAWSAQLGAAASEAMWRLLAMSPAGAVIDSTLPRYRRRFVEAGLKRAEVTRPLELWCDVPADVARERCRQRASARHPIHGAVDDAVDDAEPTWRPLRLGPSRAVDTRSAVDVIELAEWCLRVQRE